MAEVAEKPAAKAAPAPPAVSDKVHTWPYLVRLEMIVATFVMVGLTIWSIAIDAPLEEPANPSRTPNPSKAPWYFLGLQEMLVYFDPWFAGVVLPSLIIVGLMLIPYIDVNPKGNGYYCFRDRWFAITVFCFGFLVLWISLIIIGTFLRGPGWYFFAPWTYWDVHKTVAITNRNFNEQIYRWTRMAWVLGDWGSNIVGAITCAFWVVGIPAIFWKLRKAKMAVLQQLGPVRYWITAVLFMLMMSLPAKMVLRWTLAIKYVWTNQYFSI